MHCALQCKQHHEVKHRLAFNTQIWRWSLWWWWRSNKALNTSAWSCWSLSFLHVL